MKRKNYLLLFLVVILAFWQVAFLKYGMKWDFVDAFLPSRYFFSESILNNQFPLWNPYLLYGIPVFADLVSVFNPEFWIVGNLFGYSNITLQFIFLLYIFIAGVFFFFFLKHFNADSRLSLGLSVAYMLSGFSIGHAQHLAFVAGYALLPLVAKCYFRFIEELNKPNLLRLAITLFLMIYASYPGITVITGYLLFTVLVYQVAINWNDKEYLKKLLGYQAVLIAIVLLSGTVLISAYFQGAPFLDRYGGLPIELAQKHAFTFKSLLSFLFPMATGADSVWFETDPSTSNGYWGLISMVLFLFTLLKKSKNKASRVILFFGVFAFLASLGNQFFLRELLYRYFPLMDMFQYPSLFRAFTIFSFLTFTGINLKPDELNQFCRKRLRFVAGGIIILVLGCMFFALNRLNGFAFFDHSKSFTEKLFSATKSDIIIFQGTIQLVFLLAFVLITLKTKSIKKYSAALLFLFILDGITATQLSIHYTVVGNTNPVKFYQYLKSSPKGFPIPGLNPIGENSDRNAQNEFTWMNNNVFPKKVTYDGLVSFKLDGYIHLADNHPDLLESIKKEPLVYFSDDVRENTIIENFETNTVYLKATQYNKLPVKKLDVSNEDKLNISDFSPQKIEIQVSTNQQQLLVYQQNFFTGWEVSVDGKAQNLLTSNFTHMAVLVPQGEHTVVFKYNNPFIIIAFLFSYLVFLLLIAFLIHFYLKRYPEKKKRVILVLVAAFTLFIAGSILNRYFYNKNRQGLAPLIAEKTEDWRNRYRNDIRILLSTQQKELKKNVPADTAFFVDEKSNLSELSYFLMFPKTDYFAFAWQGAIISEEVLELIYSFYPRIIEQEQTHNSGILLLEKGELESKYTVIQDFEPNGTDEWERNNARIRKDFASGNHTWFYDDADEWGTTVGIPVTEELLSTEKITMLSDFMFEKEIAEAILVFTTVREGKTHLYEVSKIERFARKPNQWARLAFTVQNPDLQEGDLIQVYFWNKNRARFHIDNLKIKLDMAE